MPLRAFIDLETGMSFVNNLKKKQPRLARQTYGADFVRSSVLMSFKKPKLKLLVDVQCEAV